MKCYFALSDDVSSNDDYYWMFVAAVKSAKKNTSLELHCLYDFRDKTSGDISNDRIYRMLKDNGVIIHLIAIDFEEELLSVYTDEYLNKIHVTKNSLYSRFLRFMIPDVDKSDDVVLYSDTDVIFLKPIEKSKLFDTQTICVGPEFDRKENFSYFNAGVMFVNLKSYRDAKKQLVNMLKDGKHPTTECCDQGYLNDIYEHKFDKLPFELNWKPYWGENREAVIVHLHGFKPHVSIDNLNNTFEDWISVLLSKNKGSKIGCIYYFSEFAKYTENSTLYSTVMLNLLCMLECQDFNYFSLGHRLRRKFDKLLGRR